MSRKTIKQKRNRNTVRTYLVIPLILMVFVIPIDVLGYTDFEFKEYSMSNSGIETTVVFGKESWPDMTVFMLSSPQSTFELESAKVKMGNSEFYLSEPKLKSFADSFIVTSHNDGIQIYSYLKNNERMMRTTIFADETKTFQSVATVKDVPLPALEPTAKNFAGILPEQKHLTIVTKQSFRNYWNDNYLIFAKVFDTDINPKPVFDDTWGTVGNANINVTLTHFDGSVTKQISGQTDKNGYWQGSQYFPENISKSGKYFVNVLASVGNSKTTDTKEMFLFGVASNRIVVTNGTQP